MKIGVIGCGFVGDAVSHSFKELLNIETYKYDPIKYPSSKIEDVKETEMSFICVPTPMSDNGEMDSNYLYDVLNKLKAIGYDGICIIKSTTLPTIVKKLIMEFPSLKIITNPEFLTERTARQDMINSELVILGGNFDHCIPVSSILYRMWPKATHKHLSAEGAMMVKYMCNVFFASKVSIFNEFFKLYQHIGSDWNKVIETIQHQKWVGQQHVHTPGPDGKFGYGGKCISPDTIIDLPTRSITAAECNPGMMILDGDNETEITKVGSRKSEIITIKTKGRILSGSNDHIHLVYENGKIVEKTLNNITINDWVIIPKLKKALRSVVCVGEKQSNYCKFWIEKFSITKEFAWLIGIWLAEGCITFNKKPTIIWTVGEHEKFLANKISSILKNIGIHSDTKLRINKMATYGESRCWVVRVRNTWLSKVFKELGCFGTSKFKRAPILRPDLGLSLVAGWLDGDGNLYKTVLSGASVSKDLIHDIDRLLLQCDILGTIKKGPNNSTVIEISRKNWIKQICKETVRIKPIYNYKGTFAPKSNRSHNLIELPKFFASKIKSISSAGLSDVISIETKSHTYNANRFHTHNCFPKDIAAMIKMSEQFETVNNVMKGTVETNKIVRN